MTPIREENLCANASCGTNATAPTWRSWWSPTLGASASSFARRRWQSPTSRYSTYCGGRCGLGRTMISVNGFDQLWYNERELHESRSAGKGSCMEPGVRGEEVCYGRHTA